jgi:hypothetical protein
VTLQLTPEEVAKWDDLITRVSRSVSRDFPDLETDDLYQDLWEDLLTGDHHIYLDEPWIKAHLLRRGRWVAWERRRENLQWSSQYTYRPSDIRLMLKTVFRQEDWDKIFLPGDATEEENRSARLDMAVDLSWALDQLSDAHYAVIKEHYGDQVVFARDSAESKMLYRAELRLTDVLNTYRGKQSPKIPRRTMSNAKANYILQELTDGA